MCASRGLRSAGNYTLSGFVRPMTRSCASAGRNDVRSAGVAPGATERQVSAPERDDDVDAASGHVRCSERAERPDGVGRGHVVFEVELEEMMGMRALHEYPELRQQERPGDGVDVWLGARRRELGRCGHDLLRSSWGAKGRHR